MTDPSRAHRPARGAAAVLVAAVLAPLLVGLATLGAPGPASAQRASQRVVVDTATAAAAAFARVAPAPHLARAVPAHRHGSLPAPAVPSPSVVLAALVVLALLLASSAFPAPRRTTGAPRVRAPPAVA